MIKPGCLYLAPDRNLKGEAFTVSRSPFRSVSFRVSVFVSGEEAPEDCSTFNTSTNCESTPNSEGCSLVIGRKTVNRVNGEDMALMEILTLRALDRVRHGC